MSIPYSPDTLTLDADADIDKINEHFAGRVPAGPLDRPQAVGNRKVATVQGLDIRTVTAEIAAERLGDVRRDPVLFNGTLFSPLPGILTLAGKGTPHMLQKPQEVMQAAVAPPAWDPVPPGKRRPVIAVIDTIIAPHPLFETPAGTDPFVLHATRADNRWTGPVLVRDKPSETANEAHFSHGTFIAGIIRREAPAAQVLSVWVTGNNGWVEESTVIKAMDWLIDYRATKPVDVVCLAFGRPPGDLSDKPTLDAFEETVARVRAAGMLVVASAGNDHTDVEIFPAAWPTVTAVGSGIPAGPTAAAKPDDFSNFGPWVDEYRPGENVISTMSPDGWARWTGTSFAVPKYAAELARDVV